MTKSIEALKREIKFDIRDAHPHSYQDTGFLAVAEVGRIIDEVVDITARHQRQEIVEKLEGMKKERNFSKDGAGVIIVDVYNQAIDDIINALNK